MLPATVTMSPELPGGMAARAAEKTPTPVPAATRAATAVISPRRAGTTRRRCCDRDIVVPPGDGDGRAESTGTRRGELPDRPSGRPETVGRRLLRPRVRSLSRCRFLRRRLGPGWDFCDSSWVANPANAPEVLEAVPL